MMRTYWIAPAAAIFATLLFSPSANADKWGFSIRVGHGASRGSCYSPRVVHRKTYRYSSRSYRGDHHYRDSHYDRHGGRDVYRSGHGRARYHRNRHYTSRRHGSYYRRNRHYR